MTTIDQVVDVVRGNRFRYANEDELQHGLELAFEIAALPAVREVRLGALNRIDFLIDAIGVEVKVDGSHRDVARQCNRYLRHDRVHGLVLVTSRVRHLKALVTPPDGKDFQIVTLAAAGL